jgi:hypothetical protein
MGYRRFCYVYIPYVIANCCQELDVVADSTDVDFVVVVGACSGVEDVV